MDTPDIEKDFWKMLESNQFVKSTNSVTDEVEEYPSAIVDMEAIVKINGEFDKYAIDEWLSSRDTYWKERVIDVIERLKIDERNTREYLTGDGEGWVAESYEDKMLVNAVYFHLQSVVRDLPTPITNEDNLK